MSLNTPYYSHLLNWSMETFDDPLFKSFNIENASESISYEENIVRLTKLHTLLKYFRSFGDPRLVYDEYDCIFGVKECFRNDFELWCISRKVPPEQYKHQPTFYSRTIWNGGSTMITIDKLEKIEKITFKQD